MTDMAFSEFEFSLPTVMLDDLVERAKTSGITKQTAMRQALADYLYKQQPTKGDTHE